MDTTPLYPYSLSARYHLICPKGASGACPGFIQFRTQRSIAVFYCHDRMCRELFPQMLSCPCKDSEYCEGNHWKSEEHICRRQERMIEDREL